MVRSNIYTGGGNETRPNSSVSGQLVRVRRFSYEISLELLFSLLTSFSSFKKTRLEHPISKTVVCLMSIRERLTASFSRENVTIITLAFHRPRVKFDFGNGIIDKNEIREKLGENGQ